MTAIEINPDYADLYAKLDVQKDGRCWRITRNGKILGDSRGYSSEADARNEIDNLISKDISDARRYDRPVLLSK